MNLQNKIIIGLIIIIIGMFFYYDIKNSESEKEKLNLRNQIASKDSLIREKDSSYSRLSLQYNSQSELYFRLKLENIKLAKDIKDRDEKIAYLLSVKVKPDTVFIDNTNTQIRDSIAYFKGYTKPFNVFGELHLKDSTTRKLKVLMDEFKILALETKLENGFFKARIGFYDLNNNILEVFKVQTLESAINIEDIEYSNSFNFGLGGRISTFELSPGALINIGNNNILFNYRLLNDKIDMSKLSWYEKLEIQYYRNF